MLIQMLGISVFTVLVLGGGCAATVKCILREDVSANLENRVNANLWEEAMQQSNLINAMEMSETDRTESAETACEQKTQPRKHSGLEMSHVMA